jgi:hypothetical protein
VVVGEGGEEEVNGDDDNEIRQRNKNSELFVSVLS